MSDNKYCADYFNNIISKVLGIYYCIDNFHSTDELEMCLPNYRIENNGQKLFDEICKFENIYFKNEEEKKFKFYKSDMCKLYDINKVREYCISLIELAAIHDFSKEVNIFICDIDRVINACFLGYHVGKHFKE